MATLIKERALAAGESPFFFGCIPVPLSRRRHVVGGGQIPVTLYEQILPRLIVILAASHENVLDVCRELERISAPDHDVSFATGLK